MAFEHPDYEPWKHGSLRRKGDVDFDYTVPYWGGDKSTLEEQRFNLTEFTGVNCKSKVATALEHCRGLRVLEIGCAPGSFLQYAHRRGFQPVGIEPCREHAEEIRVFSGCPVLCGHFEELTFPNTFHSIVALDVIEHVPDPEAFVAKCMELLEPGGRLVLMTPVFGDGIPWRECDFHREHVTLFSVEHIRQWLNPIVFELWWPGHMLIVCEKEAA